MMRGAFTLPRFQVRYLVGPQEASSVFEIARVLMFLMKTETDTLKTGNSAWDPRPWGPTRPTLSVWRTTPRLPTRLLP